MTLKLFQEVRHNIDK